MVEDAAAKCQQISGHFHPLPASSSSSSAVPFNARGSVRRTSLANPAGANNVSSSALKVEFGPANEDEEEAKRRKIMLCC